MNPWEIQEKQYQCPLCGYRFAHGDKPRCSSCPSGGSCDLICCPHCGYGFVERSRILEWIGKWVRRKTRP